MNQNIQNSALQAQTKNSAGRTHSLRKQTWQPHCHRKRPKPSKEIEYGQDLSVYKYHLPFPPAQVRTSPRPTEKQPRDGDPVLVHRESRRDKPGKGVEAETGGAPQAGKQNQQAGKVRRALRTLTCTSFLGSWCRSIGLGRGRRQGSSHEAEHDGDKSGPPQHGCCCCAGHCLEDSKIACEQKNTVGRGSSGQDAAAAAAAAAEKVRGAWLNLQAGRQQKRARSRGSSRGNPASRFAARNTASRASRPHQVAQQS